MPDIFRAFCRCTGIGDWDKVVSGCETCVTTLQAAAAADTGLLPDFVQPCSAQNRRPCLADPAFLEGEHEDRFYYSAGRTPRRTGIDGLLHGDPESPAQACKTSP